MAWRSHGVDNISLIAKLAENSIITNPRVKQAMVLTDRGHYLRSATVHEAYQDHPVPIGHGATISAPHMHAHVLELLESNLVPGAKVLDVGSGSGYLLEVFAHMLYSPKVNTISSSTNGSTVTTASSSASGTSTVSSSSSSSTASTSSASNSLLTSGKVYGVEHIPELVTFSVNNLNKNNQTKQWLQEGKISVQVGDGRYGLPDTGPYDAIHVGAAAPQIPQELVDQLAKNGRMIIPVGPNGGDQVLVMLTKDTQGKVSQEIVMGVRYVPLTSREYQESHQ